MYTNSPVSLCAESTCTWLKLAGSCHLIWTGTDMDSPTTGTDRSGQTYCGREGNLRLKTFSHFQFTFLDSVAHLRPSRFASRELTWNQSLVMKLPFNKKRTTETHVNNEDHLGKPATAKGRACELPRHRLRARGMRMVVCRLSSHEACWDVCVALLQLSMCRTDLS